MYFPPTKLNTWLRACSEALKSVRPVVESLSDKEMRTFGRICAHHSASETINMTLCRTNTKPASVNYFAVMVLETNKIYGAFPSFFSVLWMLWNIMFQRELFVAMSKSTCFIF